MRLEELLAKIDRDETTFGVCSPATSGPLVNVPDLLSFAVNADPHLHSVACWLIKVFAFGDDYVLLKSFSNRTRNGFCGQCSRGFVGASLK